MGKLRPPLAGPAASSAHLGQGLSSARSATSCPGLFGFVVVLLTVTTTTLLAALGYNYVFAPPAGVLSDSDGVEEAVDPKSEVWATAAAATMLETRSGSGATTKETAGPRDGGRRANEIADNEEKELEARRKAKSNVVNKNGQQKRVPIDQRQTPETTPTGADADADRPDRADVDTPVPVDNINSEKGDGEQQQVPVQHDREDRRQQVELEKREEIKLQKHRNDDGTWKLDEDSPWRIEAPWTCGMAHEVGMSAENLWPISNEAIAHQIQRVTHLDTARECKAQCELVTGCIGWDWQAANIGDVAVAGGVAEDSTTTTFSSSSPPGAPNPSARNPNPTAGAVLEGRQTTGTTMGTMAAATAPAPAAASSSTATTTTSTPSREGKCRLMSYIDDSLKYHAQRPGRASGFCAPGKDLQGRMRCGSLQTRLEIVPASSSTAATALPGPASSGNGTSASSSVTTTTTATSNAWLLVPTEELKIADSAGCRDKCERKPECYFYDWGSATPMKRRDEEGRKQCRLGLGDELTAQAFSSPKEDAKGHTSGRCGTWKTCPGVPGKLKLPSATGLSVGSWHEAEDYLNCAHECEEKDGCLGFVFVVGSKKCLLTAGPLLDASKLPPHRQADPWHQDAVVDLRRSGGGSAPSELSGKSARVAPSSTSSGRGGRGPPPEQEAEADRALPPATMLEVRSSRKIIANDPEEHLFGAGGTLQPDEHKDTSPRPPKGDLIKEQAPPLAQGGDEVEDELHSSSWSSSRMKSASRPVQRKNGFIISACHFTATATTASLSHEYFSGNVYSEKSLLSLVHASEAVSVFDVCSALQKAAQEFPRKHLPPRRRSPPPPREEERSCGGTACILVFVLLGVLLFVGAGIFAWQYTQEGELQFSWFTDLIDNRNVGPSSRPQTPRGAGAAGQVMYNASPRAGGGRELRDDDRIMGQDVGIGFGTRYQASRDARRRTPDRNRLGGDSRRPQPGRPQPSSGKGTGGAKGPIFDRSRSASRDRQRVQRTMSH